MRRFYCAILQRRLCSFPLTFLCWYISFGCLVSTNSVFIGPCIVMYFYSKINQMTALWTSNLSMPNRQRKYINIKTSKENYTKPTLQYGIIKSASGLFYDRNILRCTALQMSRKCLWCSAVGMSSLVVCMYLTFRSLMSTIVVVPHR